MRSAEIQVLTLPDGKTLTVTKKHHAFNLFTQPDEDLWTFDKNGRIIGMYIDGRNYRRSMNNTFYRKSRIVKNGRIYRDMEPVSKKIADSLLSKADEYLKTALDQTPESFKNIILRIMNMGAEGLRLDGQLFEKIYLPVTILPPDQYMALVLQITEGCNYNQCTFCDFYHDRPFRLKSQEEIEKHIDQVMRFFGDSIALRKSIFLADANALVTPIHRLVQVMEQIRARIHYPVFSFIDVFTGIKKKAKDFKTLKNLGLQRLYLGVESGDAELLQFLHKEQNENHIIDLAESIKMGGVRLGVIFMAGAGGNLYRENHLARSLYLIKKLPLTSGDILYISEFYKTNPEYEIEMNKRKISLPSREEIRDMSMEFRREVKKIVPKGVTVSVYDIQQFIY